MDYKPKRYIIEMCNDYIKKFENGGKSESAEKVNKYRNDYICGFLTETDVIKAIMAEAEK